MRFLPRRAGAVAPLAALAASTTSFAAAQVSLDVPYVPTPQEVVDRMLALGDVHPGEFHIDLGSGDGCIAVTSAAKHDARAFGVDLNPVRLQEARANAKKAGVSGRATFEQRNLFETDISKADIVTMYLLPSVNLRLRPKILSDMWPGTRVVSHAFDMGDWDPDRRDSVIGRSIYVWVVPANARGRWTVEGPRTFILNIEQKYQHFSGTAELGGKSIPLHDGALNGADIGFMIEIDGLPYRFEGHVSGDRIEGRRNEWRASRAR